MYKMRNPNPRQSKPSGYVLYIKIRWVYACCCSHHLTYNCTLKRISKSLAVTPCSDRTSLNDNLMSSGREGPLRARARCLIAVMQNHLRKGLTGRLLDGTGICQASIVLPRRETIVLTFTHHPAPSVKGWAAVGGLRLPPRWPLYE